MLYNLQILGLVDERAIFALEEIKRVVFAFGNMKSPGPDGLIFAFFKTFWNLIGNDLMILFEVFHIDFPDLHRLNCAFISLVPKKKGLLRVCDFTPLAFSTAYIKLSLKFSLID